jgi:hypothetical protein
MSDAALVASALRALRDCGPILVRFDHKGYGDLFDAGLVSPSLIGDDEDMLVFRLTPAGEAAAKELP